MPEFQERVALPEPEFRWKMRVFTVSPVSLLPIVQELEEVAPEVTVPAMLLAVRVSK